MEYHRLKFGLLTVFIICSASRLTATSETSALAFTTASNSSSVTQPSLESSTTTIQSTTASLNSTETNFTDSRTTTVPQQHSPSPADLSTKPADATSTAATSSSILTTSAISITLTSSDSSTTSTPTQAIVDNSTTASISTTNGSIEGAVTENSSSEVTTDVSSGSHANGTSPESSATSAADISSNSSESTTVGPTNSTGTSIVDDPCASEPCQNNGSCFWNREDDNYVCNCTIGWNGTNCAQDVDECERSLCDVTTSDCMNLPGSYECRCKDGFNQTAENLCEDINECVIDSHQCDLTASQCVNTNGRYTCDCNEGYTHHDNDVIKCHKIDFCQAGLDNCTRDQICKSTPTGFQCKCKPSYYEKDGVCEQFKVSKFDIQFSNEVYISQYDNTASEEYKAKVAALTEKIQAVLNESQTVLVTELKSGSIIAQTVITSQGSSDDELKEAIEKLSEIGSVETIDTQPSDFCLPTLSDCDPVSTICTGLENGYMCTCKPGFDVILGVNNYCTDIDECAVNNCSSIENSVCENTVGSYDCTEQSCESNPCSNGGLCSITSGDKGYVCSCTDGWTGVDCQYATVTRSDYDFLMKTAIGIGVGLASLVLFSILTLVIVCCTENKGKRYRTGKRNIIPMDDTTLDNWMPSLPRPKIRPEAFNSDSIEMRENQPKNKNSNRESNSGADNPAFIPEPDYDAEHHEGRHTIHGRRNEHLL